MKYAIVGAGGHALEIKETLISLGTDNIDLDFFVEESFHEPPSLLNVQPLDNLKNKIDKYQIVIAIGDGSARERISQGLGQAMYPSVVHKSAVLGTSVRLGIGTYLAPFACLTAHVQVGKFCIINAYAGAGHGCIIGNFVQLSPHAALMGDVRLGHHVQIGPNAIVLSGVQICDYVKILPGSVVNKSIKDPGIYGGCPARKIGK